MVESAQEKPERNRVGGRLLTFQAPVNRPGDHKQVSMSCSMSHAMKCVGPLLSRQNSFVVTLASQLSSVIQQAYVRHVGVARCQLASPQQTPGSDGHPPSVSVAGPKNTKRTPRQVRRAPRFLRCVRQVTEDEKGSKLEAQNTGIGHRACSHSLGGPSFPRESGNMGDRFDMTDITSMESPPMGGAPPLTSICGIQTSSGKWRLGEGWGSALFLVASPTTNNKLCSLASVDCVGVGLQRVMFQTAGCDWKIDSDLL